MQFLISKFCCEIFHLFTRFASTYNHQSLSAVQTALVLQWWPAFPLISYSQLHFYVTNSHEYKVCYSDISVIKYARRLSLTTLAKHK